MKYIDSEKLIAEIKHRIKLNKEMLKIDSRPSDWGRIQEGSYILRFIERIQQEQPGVDLEKEIKNYLATKCADDDEPSVSEIARHFYKLGLNAKKEGAK